MIPVAICLFTSTRGHFDVKTRYLETLHELEDRLGLDNFAGLHANVKVSPGEETDGALMKERLEGLGFTVKTAVAQWSHGAQSHQSQYLADLYSMYNDPVIKNEYVLHLEDDWLLSTFDRNGMLTDEFETAVRILRDNPETVQVRFPRFADEAERIVALYAKHGINGVVRQAGDDGFHCNDFSLNPSVFRTRDLKIATDLFMRGGHGLPQHVEHGLGVLVKHLSRDNAPLFVLNPARVKAAHIGTKPGEEDSLTEPLYAN